MSYSLLTKDRRKKNVNVPVVDIDNEQVQIDWINGLIEQIEIEFANRPDVLPGFILHLIVERRSGWSER